MKISFIGDIMCEPTTLKTAKTKNGYDFNPIFENVKEMFSQSDFVIGNLETPMAGSEVGYTDSFYIFNSPDEYADAVKNAGIGLVSTANNHTFDRGMQGLVRTLEVLDEKGILHAGTCAPGEERPEACYFEVDSVKFAVIAYTYATNYEGEDDDWRRVLCEGEYEGTVNLLKPQTASTYLPGVWRGEDKIDKLFKRLVPDEEKRGWIKIFLGREGQYPRADDRIEQEWIDKNISQLKSDIEKAKQKADIVIAYPHVGGQFNQKPGAMSRLVVDTCIKAGADAVMAGHSHCVQMAEFIENKPCFYSLGNFSMSPISSLMLKEVLPAYNLCVHLYIEDKKIVKTTFSILKIVEKRGKLMKSYPVDKLYETLKTQKQRQELKRDVAKILEVVKGKADSEIIKKEYELGE